MKKRKKFHRPIVQDKKLYGHVYKSEEFKFNDFTMTERQAQYTRGILSYKEYVNVKYLREALEWKFGKCILSDESINEVKNYFLKHRRDFKK